MLKVLSKALSLFAVLSILFCSSAVAADKGSKTKESDKKNDKKKPAIDMTKVIETEVEIKKGKKKIMKPVDCYQNKAGDVFVSKNKIVFKTFAEQYNALKATATTSKQKQKLDELDKLKKATKKTCKLPENQPTPVAPAETPAPEPSSLDPYTGAFTEAQARMLYDRFGFGAKAGQAELAVQEGLEATANRMITYVNNPNLDLAVGDLACDGELESEGDKDNRQCEPDTVYAPGVRYGMYKRILETESPFIEKLFFFLHDERMAAGVSNLNNDDTYVIIPHINMIRRAAITGDYKQFMRDWNIDDLGHRIWLDGGVNNGFSPNENYAREFWELGTVGPTDSNGNAVYDDTDIAQAALALSGRWNSYHAVGPKVVFHGTPYEKVIDNADDLLEATFAHPRTAIHLAEDIWKEFVTPVKDVAAIEKLAALIRANNYNLLPVFKTLMMSRAVFAAENQKSLIKHPIELVLGFLRETGIPVSRGTIDTYLTRLGEAPLLPPTVFGYYEDRLAGEAYVFDTLNSLSGLTRDTNEWKKRNYSLMNLVKVEDPNVAKAPVVADRIARLLNLNLSDELKKRLVTYLDYDLTACNATVKAKGLCFDYKGASYYLKDNLFSPSETNDENYQPKVQYLLQIMASLPDYKVK